MLSLIPDETAAFLRAHPGETELGGLSQPEVQALASAHAFVPRANEPPLFARPEEQQAARPAFAVIREMENQPQRVPSVAYLTRDDVQTAVVEEVASRFCPAQLEIEGVAPAPDIIPFRWIRPLPLRRAKVSIQDSFASSR